VIQIDPVCQQVLRAAYQISGLTGGAVAVEQVSRAVPVSPDQLRESIGTLKLQGLASPELGGEAVALTIAGIEAARRLPPVSEPPMFQDI
jgi:hypothetical protein